MINKKKVISVFVFVLLYIFAFTITFIYLFNQFNYKIEEEIEETSSIEIIEVIKEVPVYIYVDRTNKIEITNEEREMIARLVYLEARGESFETQCGVVSVVINRLRNGYWGNTIKDVIFASGQFTPAKSIYKTTPKEMNYEAVDFVLEYDVTLPYYVMYFNAGGFRYTPYKETGVNSTYINDKTCFSYMGKNI
jgi:hypothetical protein